MNCNKINVNKSSANQAIQSHSRVSPTSRQFIQIEEWPKGENKFNREKALKSLANALNDPDRLNENSLKKYDDSCIVYILIDTLQELIINCQQMQNIDLLKIKQFNLLKRELLNRINIAFSPNPAKLAALTMLEQLEKKPSKYLNFRKICAKSGLIQYNRAKKGSHQDKGGVTINSTVDTSKNPTFYRFNIQPHDNGEAKKWQVEQVINTAHSIIDDIDQQENTWINKYEEAKGFSLNEDCFNTETLMNTIKIVRAIMLWSKSNEQLMQRLIQLEARLVGNSTPNLLFGAKTTVSKPQEYTQLADKNNVTVQTELTNLTTNAKEEDSLVFRTRLSSSGTDKYKEFETDQLTKLNITIKDLSEYIDSLEVDIDKESQINLGNILILLLISKFNDKYSEALDLLEKFSKKYSSVSLPILEFYMVQELPFNEFIISKILTIYLNQLESAEPKEIYKFIYWIKELKQKLPNEASGNIIWESNLWQEYLSILKERTMNKEPNACACYGMIIFDKLNKDSKLDKKAGIVCLLASLKYNNQNTLENFIKICTLNKIGLYLLNLEVAVTQESAKFTELPSTKKENTLISGENSNKKAPLNLSLEEMKAMVSNSESKYYHQKVKDYVPEELFQLYQIQSDDTVELIGKLNNELKKLNKFLNPYLIYNEQERQPTESEQEEIEKSQREYISNIVRLSDQDKPQIYITAIAFFITSFREIKLISDTASCYSEKGQLLSDGILSNLANIYGAALNFRDEAIKCFEELVKNNNFDAVYSLSLLLFCKAYVWKNKIYLYQAMELLESYKQDPDCFMLSKNIIDTINSYRDSSWLNATDIKELEQKYSNT